MLKTKNYQFWFCTGSQDLYGDECLAHVAEHAKKIVEALNASGNLPYEVVWKPTLITNELIRRTFNEANTDENCAGVITWMHTFSPAKSWILGLQEFRKPLLHLHTQFNREIPYDTIDMDFMNENQSAHGDREFGHIFSRLHMNRKVVVGYWADEDVQKQIGSWMRTAVGVVESSHIRVMRIADNMRNVAVTEGDKVEAQMKEAGIRCSVDRRSEKMGYKIREARLERVPYMLVVGAKEEEEGKVSVRSRYLGDEGMKDLGEFIAAIKEEIKNKTIRKIEVEEEKK